MARRRRGVALRHAAGGTSLRSGPACGAARSACPVTGQRSASGQLSQRGMRARQTVAPRSISACAEAGPNEPSVRSRTRRTFTSTGSTGRSKANRATASAVYRPTPGSSVRSSRPALGGDSAGRAVQVERRGGCSRAPATRGSRPRASRRRAPRPKASARATQRYLGTTRATCVCWSMTSETRIAYGSRVFRQGRSRPCSSNQARSASSTAPTLQRAA